MAEIQKYTEAINETLRSENLQNVGIGIAETLTDSVLDDGILKDIPILGSVIGLTKAGINIKDRLFLKKLIYFLANLSEIPTETRDKMINKIDQDEKYRIKVGEKLLYIIDQCEDHVKAEMTSIFFEAFLLEAISYNDFLNASRVIQNITIEDLNHFVQNNWTDLPVEGLGDYISWGLFEIAPISLKLNKISDLDWERNTTDFEIDGGELMATISDIGKIIRSVLRDKI